MNTLSNSDLTIFWSMLLLKKS